MVQLSELNRISIAEICVYTPAIAIAILLATRHGFGRNAGWLYLIIFSLVRILGSALQLATINSPTNVGLIIGASTLQSIGLSPLILIMLGLISRVLEGIRQTRDTVVTPRHMRLVQLLVMVALILGIVGGVNTGNQISKAFSNPGQPLTYKVPTESTAGIALMIVSFGLLIVASVLTSFHIGAAPDGDKRLLLAIAVASPFVLVRLIYSALATFGNNPNFRIYGGSSSYTDYLLGMAVVMEMIAIAIFEGVGLTLRKATVGRRDPEAIPMGATRGSQGTQSTY